MDSRRLFAVGISCLLGSAAAQRMEAQASSPAVRYRLTGGSTLTHEIVMVTLPPVVVTSTSLVQGSFVLTGLVSPLDWQVYALTDLVATAPELEGGPLTISGGGTYGVGGRGVLTQELNLTVRGTFPSPLQLASGSVPAEQAWPVLDITVTNTVSLMGARHNYTLRLVAVPELRSWHYRLLAPSTLLDDCPVCDRLSIPQPLRGDFDLVLFDENPITSRYALCDLDLAVGSKDAASYRVAGGGLMEIGGEVALQQVVNLEATVTSAAGPLPRSFTNDSPAVTQLWPVLAVDLTDTAGDMTRVYHLHLLAAPLREIWFSTTHSLTPGSGKLPDKMVSAGDVLCDSGRIVKHNSELMKVIDGMPVVGGYGIDAFDVMPGGEVVFSLNDDVFSELLGRLFSEGDLLSPTGQEVKLNSELMANFFVTLPVIPGGLDAVQVMDDGEILFSIRQDVLSDGKGWLHHGDLLSDRGEIRKSNQQLLARFQPPDPQHDYGLDAVYVWPSGEIWFSTEEGFNDPVWNAITDGDLLSDQGYVVFRNLELVGAFSPLEDLGNFGLDGLFVVTDAAAAPAPTLLALSRPAANGDLTLRWQGKGRVFQLERTLDLNAPFAPYGDITPDLEWPDPGVVLANPKAFYRVRQW